jgi:tetratricopeptide (TPR) repeat protein
LKNSIGEFISITSFFSASFDRQLALFYVTDSTFSNDFERVLFDIEADPRLDGVKPFANINSLSYFCGEKEVLMTIGSIFRLINIFQEDGVWIIQMKMCSDHDHDLKSTFEHIKNEYGPGDTTLLSFGHVLVDMGKFNEAEKYFTRLLNELPSDHKDIAHCYHSLGGVAQEKGDYESSLEWHHKSLELKMRTLRSDDPSLAESYSSMGCVYDDKRNYSNSLESYEKALSILKQAFGENHLKVAQCLDSMGLVYNNEKKYSEAIEYHQKALAIMQDHLPANHHQLGLIHTSIGNLYRNLGQYDLAMEHYKLSLNICKKSLPPDHSNNAWTLKNIGRLHENKGELHQASSFYEQAATIYRRAYSRTHHCVVEIEQLLQNVLSRIDA